MDELCKTCSDRSKQSQFLKIELLLGSGKGNSTFLCFFFGNALLHFLPCFFCIEITIFSHNCNHTIFACSCEDMCQAINLEYGLGSYKYSFIFIVFPSKARHFAKFVPP